MPHDAHPVAQADAFAPGEAVAVLLPLPLEAAYDYRVPAGLPLAAGDFVRVPLGRRRVTGVVWGPARGGVPAGRLKDVEQRLEAPPLPEVSRRFVEWVAAYTLAPPGAVLKMAMSVPEALAPDRPRLGYRLAAAPPALRMTDARQRVLELVRAGPLAAADLAREAGVSTGVVRGLAEAGALEAVPLAEEDETPPDWQRPGPALSPPQREAADALRAAVDDGFSVTLLEGVTGSGKTEVYLEAVAAALARGRQVLVLLPEIALSSQWLDRFAARFGAPPHEWHSDLPPARRRRTWRAVAEGRARVVVGARSALFLPYPDLGLVVVDEEHESSFKQEEGVVYHARDMAVVRGRLGAIPVVLASATPSLETQANVQAGRYRRLHLPDRHAGAALPTVELVDLRRHRPPPRRWLSPPLLEALAETLERGEQSLLYLNRRGYAPLTLCRACGHRLQCPNCSAWLVEHRRHRRLQCHHCGHAVPLPDACPECEAQDSLAACGPGVERLHEEVSACFPEARCAVMASDTVTSPAATAEMVRRMAAHEIDVLIGTQIVAKGHHFPLLTLVGVVDADLGLAGGDLRAAERTWQLLSQVAGRAGRADRPGRVLLQTCDPGHPVMQALAAGDSAAFVAEEAAGRRAAGMPPFGRLAALIVSGADAAAVETAARALARAAPSGGGVRVLGPAPAPLALLRGRFRWRLLLQAERRVNVQAVLRRWLAAAPAPSGVRVQVDVDPQSFL